MHFPAPQHELCRQKTKANKFNFNQKYHGCPVVTGAREGSWRVVCCVPLGKGIFTLKPQSRERREGRRVERGRLAPHLPFHVTGNKLTLIETMLKARSRSAQRPQQNCIVREGRDMAIFHRAPFGLNQGLNHLARTTSSPPRNF